MCSFVQVPWKEKVTVCWNICAVDSHCVDTPDYQYIATGKGQNVLFCTSAMEGESNSLLEHLCSGLPLCGHS